MNGFTQKQIDEMMLTGLGKRTLIENKINLDVLVKDEDFFIRLAVAKQGYGFDVLTHDPHHAVRTEVAKKGYALDTLVNDESWFVRIEVAEHGFGIEHLINDEESEVVEVCNQLKGITKTIVIDEFFGTYEGNLFLYIFEDKYLIRSGCYVSECIEEWKLKCSERINENTAKIYSEKIKKALKSYNFLCSQ